MDSSLSTLAEEREEARAQISDGAALSFRYYLNPFSLSNLSPRAINCWGRSVLAITSPMVVIKNNVNEYKLIQ